MMTSLLLYFKGGYEVLKEQFPQQKNEYELK